MNDLHASDLDFGNDTPAPAAPTCRDLLRVATQAPHERLHLHAGFSAVKDGTIGRADYRALLIRLYGFYRNFEPAVGQEPIRTQWLAEDLLALGLDAAAFARIRLCADIPRYDCQPRQLGALYVVEGSALGGRMLGRGLDALLGQAAVAGRRFFAGRGAATGAAWLDFVDQLGSVDSDPASRAALVSSAVETFEVFETWLNGWDKTK